jgi:hypothetical protein
LATKRLPIAFPALLAASACAFLVAANLADDCPFTRMHCDSGSIQSLQERYRGKGGMVVGEDDRPVAIQLPRGG